MYLNTAYVIFHSALQHGKDTLHLNAVSSAAAMALHMPVHDTDDYERYSRHGATKNQPQGAETACDNGFHSGIARQAHRLDQIDGMAREGKAASFFARHEALTGGEKCEYNIH